MLPVIAGIEGLELSARERELFSRLQPAGYILFSRNVADYEQVRELTDALRSLTLGEDEPVIAMDEEGGRVVRTSAIGVRLPGAAALARTCSPHAVRQAALYNARCLLTLGVNTNFAPVLDLDVSKGNALPGRCWGRDTQQVISYAGIWNRETSRMGILTCGKHFPGMGAAVCDPHEQLPVLHGSRDYFLREAAMPFTALMPELPSLMIAHVLIPEIDPDFPASLSPALVRDFLRLQLGYEGIVFTDDLCMGAITSQYSPAQSVPLALRAGCDLPLVCHGAAECLEEVAEAVKLLPDDVLSPVGERIARYRMMISTLPPMTFLMWNDFLRDVEAFVSSASGDEADPDSPVARY